MYVYRIPRISPVHGDEITGLHVIGRKVYSAYTYIHKGNLYNTLHFKHAMYNATIIAVQEGVASRVPVRSAREILA